MVTLIYLNFCFDLLEIKKKKKYVFGTFKNVLQLKCKLNFNFLILLNDFTKLLISIHHSLLSESRRNKLITTGKTSSRFYRYRHA